ncbi:ABC transporter substrate-binding protein [Spirochaetia bacterium]|nr:ABC transporter substrate-binding protein [Spirochaetia bacterium]
MKRTMFIMMGLLAAAGMLYAGGGQGRGQASTGGGVYQPDPNLNALGVLPIAKNKVPLKIGIEAQANVENFQTNWMSRQLAERGNFDLTFEVYPAGEMAQKVELMVMAGGSDLPDVIIGTIDIGVATKYGQAGMIIPTNAYYANSAYWSKESAKDLDQDPLKYVTSYDGNIYGLYGINVSLNNSYSNGRLMIYEPWLTKLGLKMPETTQEFLETLRAFRDRDPNGNGQKDEIPLISFNNNMGTNYLYALMTPFIYTQINFWLVNNGKIDVSFNKPQWREGIRFTKQLLSEGLLSPLSFTQDNPQMTAIISPDPPKVGVVNRISMSNLGANDAKRGQFVPIPPLQGPGGRQSFYQPQLPQLRMIITKNCKNPEAAFRLGDLMGSEEFSIMTRWGEKGVDWKPPAANSKSVWGALGNPMIEPILAWGTMQNKYWGEIGPRILSNKHSAMDIDTGNRYDFIAPMGKTIESFVKYRKPEAAVAGLIYNEQEQEVINEFHSTILSYARESFARFVMGDLNIDRDWDSYVAEFNKMGLADVIKATQSAYDRMNK